MDIRNVLLNKIQRNISYFASAIQSNIRTRRTDILIDAEDIFCGVLNLVYDYHLVNTNQEKSAFSAVDLIDVERHVSVQVTATNNRAEVEDTIKRFLSTNLHKQFDTLIMLILVNAPRFRSRQEFAVNEFNLKIMTLQDLVQEMEALDISKLEKIVDYLQKEIGAPSSEVSVTSASASAETTAIDELPDISLEVLLYASLLSDNGLERTVFERGLSRVQFKDLRNLIENHFLYEDAEKAILYIYPDIREKCRGVLKTRKTRCTVFLDSIWDYEQSRLWDRMPVHRKILVQKCLALIYENAADLLPDYKAVYLQRSAELWQNLKDYENALRTERRALTFLESGKNKGWDIARAYHFTGNCNWESAETHRDAGEQPHAVEKFSFALNDWEKVLKLCRDSLSVSDPDLATAIHNVGRAQLALEKYYPARETLLDALNHREQLHRTQPDFPGLIKIYEDLARVYSGLSNSKSAELCRSKADNPGGPLWEYLNTELESTARYSLELPPISGLFAMGFVGRANEIREIAQQIKAGIKPVILSGLGGMGKTELAIRFGQQYTEGTVCFVRFQTSFTYTIASMYAGIRPQPVVGNTPPTITEQYQMVMSVLERFDENDLLIIDNVDADSGNLGDLMRDPAYQVLRQLRVRLLLTTRSAGGGGGPMISLAPLHHEELYNIFEQHGVDIDELQMDALIDAVGGHTLTVDLIARTLNGRGLRRVSPNQLIDAIRSNTLPSEKYRKIASDYNQSVEQARIFQHLSTAFDVQRISEEERCIMRYATLLPSEGMDGEFFVDVLTEDEENAVDILVDSGWLTAENGVLSIHPVIRLVCCETLKPSDENCRDFLEALWTQFDSKRYEQIKYKQMAEVFSLAAETLEDAEGKWLNCAGLIWNELKQPQRVEALYEKFLPHLERRLPENPTLAAAYNNLGLAYNDMGDFHKALEYQLKSLSIREKILPADDPDLGMAYNNVGISYGNLGDHMKAMEYKLKALSLHEKILPADHPDLAFSYNNIGSTYSALGDYDKALEYMLKDVSICEKTLPPDHPDLADSYNNVGIAYSNLGDSRKALEYQLKALAIREKVLTPDHPDLAVSYNDVGVIYSDLGDNRKALEYMEMSLRIRQKTLSVDHPIIATSYNNVGMVYGNLGDHRKALEYMEKALAIRQKVLPQNHPELAVSYVNIGWAYGGIGEYTLALEYMKEALRIQEAALPPEHPDTKNTRKYVAYFKKKKDRPKWMDQIN